MKTSAAHFFMIWKCCTDFQFYSQVIQTSNRQIVRFFFTLILFYSFLMALIMSPAALKGVPGLFNWAAVNLPSMEITNGKLKVPGYEGPYKKQWDLDIPVIIDTSDEMPVIPDKPVCLIILSNKIIVRSASVLRQFFFPPDLQLKINKDTILQWRNKYLWPGLLILALLVPVYFILSKGFQILCFSLIFQLLQRVFQWNLTRDMICKIAVFAICPPLVLTIIVLLFGLPVPHFDLLYYGIYTAFIAGGINAVSNLINGEKKENDQQESF